MIDRLHYISQEGAHGENHVQMIERACKARVSWVQLRIKEASEAYILEQAEQAAEICKKYGAKLIINDHPHIAMQVKADGVHLGQQDADPLEARRLLGDDFIIGGTANTWEHVEGLIKKGVNYIGLGPFRFTATKEKLSPILGLEGYEQIIKRMRLLPLQVPVIAIGGLSLEDVPSLRSLGVHGVAVASLINKSEEPTNIIKKLKIALNEEFENS
ncbi:thiamine phosphate synthase [Fulvivirga sediminis]|uniref:Thiamine-phosphate synthase n=1 Tax=Fulvivirga sediminis TaxID=2803949 RepID=A0A937F5R4_9BACT|nr:thiamine phosphate synthase [Fulvivirga sediminis]MBL3655154.1 thiamine phosphate synthase [Fulvivirga sediminis]